MESNKKIYVMSVCNKCGSNELIGEWCMICDDFTNTEKKKVCAI